MRKIKAIETVYNDYRFRSRLEARWAVFFDTLGIEYQYEPEGFDLGGGIWYLPDFWLPAHKWWIEAKGIFPSGDEMEKAALLAQQGMHPIVIFWSGFDIKTYANSIAFWKDENSVFLQQQYFAWHFCPACSCTHLLPLQPQIIENGELYYVIAGCYKCPCQEGGGKSEMSAIHPALMAAYTAARQARFESPPRAQKK